MARQPKKTFEETLDENKQKIRKGIRELDREKMRLESDERKIQADIRSAAQSNNMEVAKIHAKSLVRTRANIKRFLKMRTQLQAISIRLQTVKSFDAMNQAMTSTTDIMSVLNTNMDITSINKSMAQFQKQNMQLQQKQELMENVFDQALGEEDEEEEIDGVVNQVFTELGVQFTDGLNVPATQVKAGQVANQDVNNELAAAISALSK